MEESIVTFLLCLRSQGLSPATIIWYRGRLLQCAYSLRCPVGEIDRDSLVRYMVHLRHRRLSPATVRGHLRAVNRFFGWCVEEGLLAENPVSAL